MLYADLLISHTRRGLPTRRVALGPCAIPTGGRAYGARLLGAVVAEFAAELSESDDSAAGVEGVSTGQLPEIRNLLLLAGRGELSMPRIALQHRLQFDAHGLDRSRHRIIAADEAGSEVAHGAAAVLELDCHGAPVPQILGAIMAAARMAGGARSTALRAIETALRAPGAAAEGLIVRRRYHAWARTGPPTVGAGRSGGGHGEHEIDWEHVDLTDDAWEGVPSEQRWAREVFGYGADPRGGSMSMADLRQRFRRLVRECHPDHGGAAAGAADRIAELTEAREVLLAVMCGS